MTRETSALHTPNSSRARDKLTDKRIQAWRKRGAAIADQKLSDGGGMYLVMTQAGTAKWRLKYRLNGDERTYTIGDLSDVGLAQAREARDAAKKLLREGIDPVQARRVARIKTASASRVTFRQFAEAWLDKERPDWSDVHYRKSRQALERDVLPTLGPLPVAEITPAMVTAVIKAIAKRGVRDTASKILQHVTAIFRFAQSEGALRHENPALPAQEALPRAKRARGRPALLSFPELGNVLRGAEAAKLSPAVRMAHRLCAFAPGCRISNIVEAQWHEFDLEGDVPTWTIPRAQMKRKEHHHDHKLILPGAFADELRAWRRIIGAKGYVFPSPANNKEHITRESLEKAYRVTLALADKHTPHGWRAAFSTLARDHGFDRDAVELTLDHVHDNDVVRAYDRGERLQQRIKLMTWWGEQLSQAQRGADVLPLKGSAA